jgi:hypothetical protein
MVSVTFEVLHGALVSFRGFLRAEGSKVPASAGLGVFLAGVESVLARFQSSNHSILERLRCLEQGKR